MQFSRFTVNLFIPQAESGKVFVCLLCVCVSASVSASVVCCRGLTLSRQQQQQQPKISTVYTPLPPTHAATTETQRRRRVVEGKVFREEFKLEK